VASPASREFAPITRRRFNPRNAGFGMSARKNRLEMKNIAVAFSACSDPLLLERQVRPFGNV
jgi:hypothetical protein